MEPTLLKLKIKSNSHTYTPTRGNKKEIPRDISYIAEITIQDFDISVKNFEDKQLIGFSGNTANKKQTGVALSGV